VIVKITNAWAEIYFKGAHLGRSSTGKVRIPVGRQVLHLINGPANKQWDVTCTVVENETKTCETALP
jgi:hypothetical protein